MDSLEEKDGQKSSHSTHSDDPESVHDQTTTAITTQSPRTKEEEQHGRWERNLTPWLQAFGSFILFCNTWGTILAFGAFQTFYEQDLLKQHSSSSISWIGTTSAFLLLLGGVTSGKIYDLGYSRILMVGGSALAVFGLFMTSLSTKYYQVFLCQGIVLGLGASLLWIPAMTVVAAGFGTNMRAVVLGVVSTGSSIGGVIYPIMFRLLQIRVGFPWAVRIIAFTVLGTFLLALAVLLPPKPPRSAKARRILDKTAFSDPRYMVFTVASIFTLMGYFTPLFFLPSFIESSVKIPNQDIAFYMLAVANGASFISRIGAGFVANRIGPGTTYLIALFFSGTLLLVWIAIHSLAGLIVWTILWGLSTGAIISLRGSLVPQLCPDLDLLGTRMGMSFIGSAFGVLIGGPIGGKLIYAVMPAKPTWWPLQVFTALAMLTGAVMNLYPCLYIEQKMRGGHKS